MKLIASSDGIIWTTVPAEEPQGLARATVRASRAAMTAATKTTVPGIATKFRLTIASSGVGIGATGGIFNTALCRHGIGILKAGEVQMPGERGLAAEEDQDGREDERRPALQHGRPIE